MLGRVSLGNVAVFLIELLKPILEFVVPWLALIDVSGDKNVFKNSNKLNCKPFARSG